MLQTDTYNKPVSDGELSEKIITSFGKLTEHKKIFEYCTPDYCLSCAYFQQTKGNFGRCTVLKNDKKFDGTKKGNSCNLWRMNKHLVEPELKHRIENRKQKQKTWIDDVRERYNKNVKIEITKRRLIKRKEYDRIELSMPKLESPFIMKKIFFKFGLPFAQSSDVHAKRAYYKHKFNKRIIDFTLKLMVENKSLSSRQISKEVQRKFNRKVSHHTIVDWGKKFAPERKFDLKNASHRKDVNDNISKGVKRYFELVKKVKPSQQTKTKMIDLFNEGYSIRQISKMVKNEYVNSTVKNVFEFINNEFSLGLEWRYTMWSKTKTQLIQYLGITQSIKYEVKN